jgi:hypothetical protein
MPDKRERLPKNEDEKQNKTKQNKTKQEEKGRKKGIRPE